MLWDIKRYFMTQLASSHLVVRLGDYIKEESTKYNISDKTKTYGILGVNNHSGIFDAYEESGAKIKQKYKKMQVGWIAYNPYRVNVGSIGIRKAEHQYEYISPAYVVFSCKEGLIPDYLFLLMKTDLFNRIIRENTTGSVRQNLHYSILSNLQIPLPSVEEQNKIVAAYNSTIAQADNYVQQADEINDQIEAYLKEKLGIGMQTSAKLDSSYRFMRIFQYRDIVNRWDINNVRGAYKGKFPFVNMADVIIKMSTGTTPPTHNKEYFNGDIDFYTPSDINGSMYLANAERHVSQKAIKDNKARLFHKGDLLFVGIGSTVGKVGLIEKDIVSSNQQITGITFNTQKILPEYGFAYMHYFKEYTTADQSKTTLPIVNQEKIAQIPIPLPPLTIQNEIVAQINALRAEQKNLQQQASNLRAQASQQFEQTIFN